MDAPAVGFAAPMAPVKAVRASPPTPLTLCYRSDDSKSPEASPVKVGADARSAIQIATSAPAAVCLVACGMPYKVPVCICVCTCQVSNQGSALPTGPPAACAPVTRSLLPFYTTPFPSLTCCVAPAAAYGADERAREADVQPSAPPSV